jgi:hypothetical protein
VRRHGSEANACRVAGAKRARSCAAAAAAPKKRARTVKRTRRCTPLRATQRAPHAVTAGATAPAAHARRAATRRGAARPHAALLNTPAMFCQALSGRRAAPRRRPPAAAPLTHAACSGCLDPFAAPAAAT